MKRNLLLALTLLFTLACALPAQFNAETDVTEPVPVIDATSAPLADEPLLYISGTFHIETQQWSWPEPDAFIEFVEKTQALGIRWSISADIGWFNGEPRAAEVVQRTAALGVQWDIHVHRHQDAAQTAYILHELGVEPTSVYSGFKIDELDIISQPVSYQGYDWQPEILWGAVTCPGHRPGCDNDQMGLWRPLNSANYETHDPNGKFIHLGGGNHQLDEARALVEMFANDEITAPVTSFTLMVAPSTLTIAKTESGYDEIAAFVAEMDAYPFIRWATIEETAQAWVASGGVPSLVEPILTE